LAYRKLPLIEKTPSTSQPAPGRHCVAHVSFEYARLDCLTKPDLIGENTAPIARQGKPLRSHFARIGPQQPTLLKLLATGG
jgi:hypothetical protein